MNSDQPSGEETASALVIAIEDYECQCHPKLDNLSASANDLARVLEQAGFVDAFPPGRNGQGKAQELAGLVCGRKFGRASVVVLDRSWRARVGASLSHDA
jgi:hypothetical protein